MNEKRTMSELERLTAGEFHEAQKIPLTLVLDNIRSGLNVGSIFRSADAFRVERIICCGYTPAPPHREVLKTALGATETVQWAVAENTLNTVKQLQRENTRCYALEQTKNSVPLHQFTPIGLQSIALVLGNEVHGVSQEVIDACDGSIEIMQFGTKHSLNVAVCAGIVLYTIFQQFNASNSE